MAENRYVYRDRRRRERHKLHQLDEDMRQNDEVDAKERHAREEQRQRDEQRHRLLLVAQ